MSTGLGDVLVAQGVIDAPTLAHAQRAQAANGASLGKTLVDLGAATEAQIVGAIARQLGLPFADMSPGAVDPQAAALLPRQVAAQLAALPVGFADGNDLVVALADPGNTAALERVAELTGMRTLPALAVRAELLRAIDHLADGDGSAASLEPVGAAPPAASPHGHGHAAATPPASPSGDAAPPPTAVVTQEPAGGGHGLLAYEQEGDLDLDLALTELLRLGGSDLHLTTGVPPTVRVHGELRPLDDFPVLTPDELQRSLYGILTQKQRETFENALELDLSYSIPGVSRFRVNIFQQRDALGAVMRVIPFEIKSIEDLGIPAQVNNFAYLPRGFVLVTGPTGSGKSTTLAALIDLVNRERSCHIMTVEDPIEFLHSHKRSVVNQRELGTDTLSFAAALKHVLRQDPDVILVGEMRDLETIQVALTAAETGHLVFGTLHTQDAPQTVDRVIDVFPPHQQEQIRVMLGGALQGVVCQQLMKTPDGRGRIAACEVMIATPAIRNLIREGKTHQMYSSIQAGKQHGMVTMDQSLATLVSAGKVGYDDALERCNNVPDFNRLCGRA